ncbi:type II toxin-antitoxin system HicB family antitoxin [Arenimonas sp.]|uniref:type II toxin-antitoxin system HicB family antitoxin n=1 Tax=Arenimonas sp. TaxID=1872635 RepID=UPI002E35778E|nr:type II toxin-antitoxin system HicB family antitoxin [Arenimonas sp.]HEX4852864.1 type II toxin-antitoxin system HicB family antitoxin [Arenimonas sp.]
MPPKVSEIRHYPDAGWAEKVNAMRYAIVIDKTDNNYGAWAPDLPGCVALGDTVEEVGQRMRSAIEMHLAGIREDGQPIPQPSVLVNYVDVAA